MSVQWGCYVVEERTHDGRWISIYAKTYLPDAKTAAYQLYWRRRDFVRPGDIRIREYVPGGILHFEIIPRRLPPSVAGRRGRR